jgi:hypothetical protein
MGKYKDSLLTRGESDDFIKDTYFRWLCDIVGVENKANSYYILASHLHSIPFTWSVPNDDNRYLDGQNLREVFIDDTDVGMYEAYILEGPCSVLEMLIGLSIRINEIMDWPEGPEVWFYEMLFNLYLIKYNDSDFNFINGREEIRKKISNLLERTYSKDGEGGLFPLYHTRKDQREVELWYQMNAYLRERYDVEG